MGVACRFSIRFVFFNVQWGSQSLRSAQRWLDATSRRRFFFNEDAVQLSDGVQLVSVPPPFWDCFCVCVCVCYQLFFLRFVSLDFSINSQHQVGLGFFSIGFLGKTWITLIGENLKVYQPNLIRPIYWDNNYHIICTITMLGIQQKWIMDWVFFIGFLGKTLITLIRENLKVDQPNLTRPLYWDNNYHIVCTITMLGLQLMLDIQQKWIKYSIRFLSEIDWIFYPNGSCSWIGLISRGGNRIGFLRLFYFYLFFLRDTFFCAIEFRSFPWSIECCCSCSFFLLLLFCHRRGRRH